ncbi:hypothetical protein QVD17_28023 [Tagetes erecta]|uniref:Uncharacterized protein n=1 Tax=Tagetes erecta TaxID=13708 RepID=A0AAD8KA22_TARER|nr:hypothetical protein QVD17_28023 [Tagetes erecta]
MAKHLDYLLIPMFAQLHLAMGFQCKILLQLAIANSFMMTGRFINASCILWLLEKGLRVEFFHCMSCNCCLGINLVDHKCKEKDGKKTYIQN